MKDNDNLNLVLLIYNFFILGLVLQSYGVKSNVYFLSRFMSDVSVKKPLVNI